LKGNFAFPACSGPAYRYYFLSVPAEAFYSQTTSNLLKKFN